MIAGLLLALGLPAQAPANSPALYVLEEERLEWVGELGPGDNWLLLPSQAHDERRPRALPGPRGIELALLPPEGSGLEVQGLRVEVVPHSTEERLLRCGEELWLASDVALPAFARRRADGRDRLPQLARLDLAGCAREELAIAAGPEGTDLFLLPAEAEVGGSWSLAARSGEGEFAPLRGARGPGHALRLDGARAWELRLGDDALDRLYHARARAAAPVEGSRLLPRRLERREAGGLEWRARLGRGPLRPHPRGVEERGAPLSPDLFEAAGEASLRLAAGELLAVELEAPRLAGEDSTQTLLVRVRLASLPAARTASARPARDELPDLFRDVSVEAGVEDVHFEGPEAQLDIRPTMGPGAAWGDFDGDGQVDLYVVQGGGREGCEPPRNRLLRNLGNGRFEGVPGAEDPGAGMGALFFDLEGDGDLDLYVANYGPDVLYRNDGAEGFLDVSGEHELGTDGWSSGVCAGDADGDGDLDLYVTSYLEYDLEQMPDLPRHPGYSREDPLEMLPFAFPGSRNTFLENVDGRLVDRTEALGLADEAGRGMQAVFWDFDLDGDPDLYVANDVSPNVLFRNERSAERPLGFEDISFQTGMDDPRGGMGVTTGDVDFDGDLDLFLTNWQLETNALYQNNQIVGTRRKQRLGTFQDVTIQARLGRPGVGLTSWGCVFFDADLDQDLDLFVPNGYTSPDYESTDLCVGQTNQLFLADGRVRFADASLEAGPAVTAPLASRAAALCDYDRDGRLDLFVTNNNGPYQLLRNELPMRGHWLGLELRGRGGNTHAIGARVELVVLEEDGARGPTLVREVSAGGGYLSGHDTGVHFGLGEAAARCELSVHWPSGSRSRHEVDELDRWMLLREPEPAGEPR